jgi:hypothetical protein
MIVVADASPLHYLILVDQIALLERLYGSVLVPEVVAAELRAARAPDPVRTWIVEPPSWVLKAKRRPRGDISESPERWVSFAPGRRKVSSMSGPS